MDTIPEDTSSAGRLDLAVRYAGQVFLFEFKVVDSGVRASPRGEERASMLVGSGDAAGGTAVPGGTAAPGGTALAQIKARGYADKYRASGVPIHLVGVEFSREQRNIVGFDVETIP
jgi:hypothetical protein